MIQRPNAVSLTLCQLAITDHTSRNTSLINTFRKLAFNEFPTEPQAFTVQSVLTDGLGQMSCSLIIDRLNDLETIYDRSFQTTFENPLSQMSILHRVSSCIFPTAGRYVVSFQIYNETVAQCVLTIFERGSDT